MTFLNTHWKFGYIIILLFVFWTLFCVGWAFSPKMVWHYYRKPSWARYTAVSLWAGMGTYVFHCIW